MPYTTDEARRQMLDDLAHAIDEIGVALAALGAAYELLDEQSGDRLEAELFRPLQLTHTPPPPTHAALPAPPPHPRGFRRAPHPAAAPLRARHGRPRLRQRGEPARVRRRGDPGDR